MVKDKSAYLSSKNRWLNDICPISQWTTKPNVLDKESVKKLFYYVKVDIPKN